MQFIYDIISVSLRWFRSSKSEVFSSFFLALCAVQLLGNV